MATPTIATIVADSQDEQIEWRPVVGYEGYYEVSNTGLVRNTMRRRRTYVGRLLKPHNDQHGYIQYRLFRNGVGKTHRAHRLVVTAFVGSSGPKREVNHINGVKTNNDAQNLEYVSRLENMRHAGRMGLRPYGESNPKSVLTVGLVRAIRDLRHHGWPIKKLAEGIGVDRVTIRNVLTGKTWRHVDP